MGDSLTDYKSAGGKFIRQLEERCPQSRFDNYGKGGEMVNQMRRRFATLFTPDKPEYTHIVIFGGVNDLYSDLTASRTNERIEADLLAMYTAAREHGAQVVAINVAPWGGFKKYFNARRGATTLALNGWIAQQRGHSLDAVVDAHTLLRCGDAHRLCPDYQKPFKDGIHFGPEGHRILGQALFEAAFENCR
jgi:lysophospholipase L1-like esterase